MAKMGALDKKKGIAKQFAKDYTAIKNIKSVRYNKKFDYFSVVGETYMGNMGQRLTFPSKLIVRVKVKDNGIVLFMTI